MTWAGESDIQVGGPISFLKTKHFHKKVTLRGMQASVVDLYVHGNMRIVFKPLLQRLPLVGGMQVGPNLDVLNQILDSLFHKLLRLFFLQFSIDSLQMFFLHSPTLDFGVGGMANVADLPGISSLIRWTHHIMPVD